MQFNSNMSGANLNLSGNNGQAEDEESGLGRIDFDKLLPILNKSLGWIILFILFSAASGYLYLRYTRQLFESSSVLKLEVREKANIKNIYNAVTSGDAEANTQTLAGEIELIKSPVIYAKVIDRMDLDVTYQLRGSLLLTELYQQSPFRVEYEMIKPGILDIPIDFEFLEGAKKYKMGYKFGQETAFGEFELGKQYQNPYFRFRITKTKDFKPESVGFKYNYTINSREALNRYLESNLSARVLNAQANTIIVSFKDYSPAKCQDIVNNVDSVYLDVTLSKKNQVAEQTLAFLDKQLDSTRQMLSGSEAQMESFLRSNKGVLDPKTNMSKLMEKLDLLVEKKLEVKLQLSTLNEIENLVIHKKEVGQFLPMLRYAKDPELSALAKELSAMLENQDRVLLSYKDNTTANKANTLKVDRKRVEVLEALTAAKEFMNNEMSQLDEKINELESSFNGMPSKDTQLNRLKRFYDLNEKFYLSLIEKKTDFGIAKAGTVPDFQVLQPANLPTIAISPQKGNIYTMWLVIGLVAGIVLVVVRYILQDTVVAMREIEKTVPAPLLGVVPVYTKERLKVAKLVVDKNPKSSLSESLRAIRTNIDFLTTGKDKKKIISVTSTVASEGKTFIAVNLGGILALSGLKVILIDLDMRKPKLHQAFDLVNDRGMSTLLIGRNTLEECICPTSVENISVIPAGPTPPNPSELLLRRELDDLIVTLQETYDIVLIDSPPVGLVTDGIIIMQKVDLPIYVVRSEYSKRVYLKNITKLVKTNGFRNLSVILNGMDKFKTYGYGYAYGYDYYTDDDIPNGFDMSWLKGIFGNG